MQFVGTFAGAISNTGVISGLRGIRFFGGNVLGDSVTGGGIVNRGTISASDTGVSVDHVNTIFGSVSHSGKILAAIGIVVKNSNGLVGVASAGAAINNSGTIAASIDGILTENGVAAISGGISNSGAITARTGIAISNSTVDGPIVDSGSIKATRIGILVDSGGVISGGIQVASKGTISAASRAILVENIGAFAGGITNSGHISGGGVPGNVGAVLVASVQDFSGGIFNAAGGVISSKTSGIGVVNFSIFSGGITNRGTIRGARSGILWASLLRPLQARSATAV